MRGIPILCLIAALGLVACTKLAPVATPMREHDPRATHAEADKNGDGMIDRQEFHTRMVEVFFHGDRDKDGQMTWTELGQTTIFPEDFGDADTNGDDQISMYEFIRVRFYDYDVVDTDSDGLLSVEEVVQVFDRGGVR